MVAIAVGVGVLRLPVPALAAILVVLTATSSMGAAAFAATWPAGRYRHAVAASTVAALEVVGLHSAGVPIVLAVALLPFLLVAPWYDQHEIRHTTT